MKKYTILLFLAIIYSSSLYASTKNPESVVGLINRVCGKDASSHFTFMLDESFNSGKEAFQLSSDAGKIRVTANTLSAMTAGLNWYLNHDARVNISWNNLRQTPSSYPMPADTSVHPCNSKYRYYLNYCTFSYSMAFWTWERWEKEIDWMALHGINAPLQLVGVDATWKKTMEEMGYTKAQIGKFIAGPGFQAWWGMVNLEGHGGPNPDWWYERQENLARNICSRERSLGIMPVLPGFAGQVPSPNVGQPANMKLTTHNCGTWIGYQRPAMLSYADAETYNKVAEIYYRNLHDIMGPSENYAMDCFHEGGKVPAGMNAKSTYDAVFRAMNTNCGEKSRCFMQQWQWKQSQAVAMQSYPQGRLVVLDLFSEVTKEQGWRAFGNYKGHESVYCMLSNFGGRVGMHGCLRSTMKNFYTYKGKYNIQGIGATMEGIETNPILYEALFELPWIPNFDCDKWLEEFVKCRYGATGETNAELLQAWKLLEKNPLNAVHYQAGPCEPVVCSRPGYSVSKVSAWGTANIFYDTQSVIEAADKFLLQADKVKGENIDYDLTDCVRQAMVNQAKLLLSNMKTAQTAGIKTELKRLQNRFLELISDLDRLLQTRPDFSLYNWITMARDITKEAKGATNRDKAWLDQQARMLITTWRSNGGTLTDYSNRCWSGLLNDYYKPRWEKFFNGQSTGNWHTMEAAWRDDMSISYTAPKHKEDTYAVAEELFDKYFHRITTLAGKKYYINAAVKSSNDKFVDETVLSKEEYEPTLLLPNDVRIINKEITNTSVANEAKVKLTLSDNTEFTYKLKMKK